MSKVLMTVLLMIIIPFIIGSVWTFEKNEFNFYRFIDSYLCGYYTMIAIFQLICVPMCFAKAKFTSVVILYTIIIGVVTAAAWIRVILVIKKNNGVINSAHVKLKNTEKFYLTLIIVILAWQLRYALFYGVTTMSYDDAVYLVYANSAVENNYMYTNNVTTGIAQQLDYQRSLQSSIMFIAYLSKMTLIDVTTIAHTVMTVQIMLMSYAAYILVSKRLFRQRENRLIFMVLIEILYIYGFYSHYSPTFRLLGAPWQGKAIFAVTLTPYVFFVLPKILGNQPKLKNSLLVLTLSIAASSLSLAGAGISIVIIVLLEIMYIVIGKKVKSVWYILWGSVAPALYCGIYLLMR